MRSQKNAKSSSGWDRLRRSPVLPHIHFCCTRLMIDAECPLSELHAAAQRCGISKRMFEHGMKRIGKALQGIPTYRVSDRKVEAVCEALGFNGCACGKPTAAEAIARCWRPSTVRHLRAAHG